MTTNNPNFDDKHFLLSEYLDGSLDAERAKNLEREMAADPELRREFESMRKLSALIQRTGEAESIELDWERFTWENRERREAGDAASRRKLVFRMFVPLAAAAAVLLVFTTTFQQLQPVPDDRVGVGALVTIDRAGSQIQTSAGVEVTVSRELPDDVLVTSGPRRQVKTLIVYTGLTAPAGSGEGRADESSSMF